MQMKLVTSRHATPRSHAEPSAGSSPATSWSTIHVFVDPGNRARPGRVTYGRVQVHYARSLRSASSREEKGMRKKEKESHDWS
ncbi:hypothetical protein PoB_000620600 [Plakobranchus ocellatus]|uniref:Uncharacterized protein n=1 Tax=Plakobranchus ocellatus TaxID=259542 RepID=A0AAV3XXM1_9GAST|nr:hypothetical protein PoB_000620600 [Plakobranchus ocellatus]